MLNQCVCVDSKTIFPNNIRIYENAEYILKKLQGTHWASNLFIKQLLKDDILALKGVDTWRVPPVFLCH